MGCHLEIKVICSLNECFRNIDVYALSGVMVAKDAIVNFSALLVQNCEMLYLLISNNRRVHFQNQNNENGSQ